MSEKIQLQVEGMSCGHCVKAVENGVGEINGVDSVNVTLDQGLVEVQFDASATNVDAIKEVIEEEGYTVK
ncbi:copper chaperone CopZ [Kurthia zopfii]|uniref:Copper chaperone CopZ n=1 Tax=Kurthia zopfii TaxID=1650 RepID=A0A8B4QE54_9BACL|nr:copper chaperone CopZ [Kurthia zopfii]TDR42203.1 copper chaperone [Kurthia zopfii]GEK29858.1 copper chaperone CopZ [Kurthia zopfii]STX10878.1 Copper-ion-binding protein [Kurthia zopfii]VEI05754.1 Copper-ion-binding protein [Kurthia zopfii]